ncbi:hypothetical protein NP493_334g00007 [Ridgeia piscesae]|uniref:PiggyBac transposable element-derived protein domain-containing protein n=1 Tax=Ridgeia piscesae TaxID=27915 RepID=A0AAD9NU32_RIDPI|nr:hypothetical protein NP493_334g00007 [Ridgeia piscesae]
MQKLKELRAKHHKTEQVKCLHQVIKQTDAVMKKLKMKLVGDSVHQELIAMETELATRKQKHRRLKLYQQCKRIGMPTPIYGNIAKLHRELHSKDAVILHLENKNLELEDIIEQLQCCSSGPLQKESKTFPQETSMFLYEAIVNHVPTRSVPILLNKFAQRSGLDSAPHCTTVEMMARELRVVAVLQATELLMTNMNQLVDETNRYTDQERRQNPPTPSAPIWMPVATNEMRVFVGLCFAMGILLLTSRNDYWRVSNWLLKTNFGTVMARDRFNLIWRYLHLANNDAPGAEGDKLVKIRWFVDFLNDQFQAVYVPYGKYTVDESMVKFKGRLEFRQYLPAKPTKWGVKVWVLAESDTGYLLKFQVYTGRAPGGQERGLTHRVVTDLVDHLYGQYTQVYFDNFYTSPDLLTYLHAWQVYACGTVRANRKNLPTALLPKNVNLKQHEFKVAQKDELSFVVWQDTKPVCVLSNFHDPTAMGAVSRRVRLGGGAQQVAVPAVVADYQKYMKGVDLMDQMVGHYIIQHRSKKWWRRIFHYLMMASAYNAYVVARDTSPEMVATEWPNFQDFPEEIVLWLVGEVRSRRDPAANPRPAPGAGRHDIVKMYEKKRTCIECSMSAAAGEGRGTTKHGCQQCQQPVHLECVCTHFHTDPLETRCQTTS